MSKPLYGGGLKGAIDAENRPWIPDDGNWSLEGTTEQPPFRSLALYVNGAEAFGYRPSAARELFNDAVGRQGVFMRADLLGWRGPILAPGLEIEMILVGGNGPTPDPYWDPNATMYMEWGSASPADAGKTVIATTGKLIVPDASAPPRPNLAKAAQLNLVASQIGQEAIKTWRTANKGEAARYDSGDNNPEHYKSRYGKFMVLLRSSASA